LGQLTFGLGYLILYLLAAVTLDRNGLALSLFGNAAVVCSAALVILTINRRRKHWAGCQRLFWDTFAVGMAIWILGHIGWSYTEIVGRSPGWLAWHTVFSLSGGAAPLLALVARPQRGVRQHATGAVGVDIAVTGSSPVSSTRTSSSSLTFLTPPSPTARSSRACRCSASCSWAECALPRTSRVRRPGGQRIGVSP
jgi:hypothetical protein